jgi:hypothetical protein
MRSEPTGCGWSACVGLHKKELRRLLACLDKVMRNELLEDVEERLEAVASAVLSPPCADDVDRLEVDLLAVDL